MEKTYLSEALNYESFKLGSFNLITAPCGTGKTTAAFNTIPSHLSVTPQHSLILVNTRSAAEAFVEDDLGIFFDYNGKTWDAAFTRPKDKPTIMTYAGFGAHIKKNAIDIAQYDYVVCDEIHVLNQYIAISRGKLRKTYPLAAPWEINDMVQMTCLTYIALEKIVNLVQEAKTWVFGLTATPTQLYKNDLAQLGNIVNEVQFSQKLHAYEIFCKYDYTEIEPILRAIVPENRKRLFFFNTIKELQQYKQILLDCGRAAEALWSDAAKETMNPHQLTTRDHILKEHRFPDDVQDLLINRAYETSINIKDPLVREVYIHTGNKDTQEQVRSRLRQDVDIVGTYDRAGLHTRLELNEQGPVNQGSNVALLQPYLGKRLFKADKDELVAQLGYSKGWTSLKKELEQQGYVLTEEHTRQGRCTTISPPQQQ